MGLGDITGVFSRYFVVGFFLPAYVSLVALWIFASDAFVPNSLESHSQATQLLILGAVALVVGLALSGSSYLVTRAFEGYPLVRIMKWPLLGLIPAAATWLQRWSQGRLLEIRDDTNRSDDERAAAAWRLEESFPHESGDLLPTRLGNVMRAFELHSNVRWGIDGVTIWPRINSLLSSEERELHVDALIDFYVFLNASLGAFAVGACLVIDEAIHGGGGSWFHWGLYATPFVVAYVLYRAALVPAANWGSVVRASIDLHRLEMYEKLGVRAPTSFSDERELATQINPALLYGTPLLSDELWRGRTEDQNPDARPKCIVSIFKEWLKGGEDR